MHPRTATASSRFIDLSWLGRDSALHAAPMRSTCGAAGRAVDTAIEVGSRLASEAYRWQYTSPAPAPALPEGAYEPHHRARPADHIGSGTCVVLIQQCLEVMANSRKETPVVGTAQAVQRAAAAFRTGCSSLRLFRGAARLLVPRRRARDDSLADLPGRAIRSGRRAARSTTSRFELPRGAADARTSPPVRAARNDLSAAMRCAQVPRLCAWRSPSLARALRRRLATLRTEELCRRRRELRRLDVAGHVRRRRAPGIPRAVAPDRAPDRDVFLLAAGMPASISVGLCVLSGCESRQGALPASLSCPRRCLPWLRLHTVLVTLWPVDDATTQTSSASFYSSLSQGGLRASLQERKPHAFASRYRGTFFWAGVVSRRH